MTARLANRSPSDADPPVARRRLALRVASLATAATLASFLLAACDTPPHKADTNSTNYNYSYNK